MVTPAHDVALRSPGFLVGSERPVILERTDQDFLRTVLAALRTESGRNELRASRARAVNGALKLYRPSHRTFNLALLDARCVTLGTPRVDRRRIEFAGFVVRRLVEGRLEGWMESGAGFRGWLPLGAAQLRADPDPARRSRASSGHAIVDVHLARRAGLVDALSEAHTRLFLAPPDVCEAAQATLLYGLIPLGASETSSAPPDVTFSEDEAREMLPGLLRAGKAQSIPSKGGRLFARDAARQDAPFRIYQQTLEQLLVQLDLRGESAESRQLRTLLAALELDFGSGEKGDALSHLQRAIDVLVNRVDPRNEGVKMPVAWAEVTHAQERAFAELVRKILGARLTSFAPRIGRFDRGDARYELWPFARVRQPDGCPPVLVWGQPSERFRIASWFEGGPVPPPLIQLPDITRENVRALKPNVAFALPPSLFNFLRANSPEKLVAGEVNEGSPNPAIEWICGFNLSIIFMIAFILMFSFVLMLNLVFSWLAFIRICIPVPASFKSKT